MWNMLKSDFYRITHTISFKRTMILFIIFMTMLYMDWGVQSNGLFASYDASKDSFVDFLYFFPKTAVFQMFCFIYLCMFISEEYNNGYVKNIYPYFQNKGKLVGSRYFTFILIYMIFSITNIILTLFLTVVSGREMGDISFANYLIYFVVQICINSVIGLFFSFSFRLFRSMTASIMLVIAHTLMFFWGLHYLIFDLTGINYLEYTIYYLNGNLPNVFDADIYGKTLLVVAVMTILCLSANYLVLKKKDL